MRWIGWSVVLVAALVGLFVALRTVRAAWVEFRRTYSEYRTVPADTLATYIRRLLRRQAGATLVISDSASDRFVQFRKYVHSREHYGLSFDFPRAPWSEPYYRDLQARLEADHTKFLLQPTLDYPVVEFLQVDCGKDVESRIGSYE